MMVGYTKCLVRNGTLIMTGHCRVSIAETSEVTQRHLHNNHLTELLNILCAISCYGHPRAGYGSKTWKGQKGL